MHSPTHLELTQAAADTALKRHNKKSGEMYKFYLIWNKGSVNLIPEELNYICFHDSVPRKQLSTLDPHSLCADLPKYPNQLSTCCLQADFVHFELSFSLAEEDGYKPKAQRDLIAANTL